ncbi:MAG: glycine cleavage T C-terminal barrel domain-containing protein, partial [Chloroflexota bacterium]
LEKSFGSWMLEYTPDYTPYEAGLGYFVDLEKGEFIGREAALATRNTTLARQRCTLVVDIDETDPIADEAVYHQDKVVGFVTSGGYGHVVQKSIALALLPTELIVEGAAFEVEILGVRRPAKLITKPLYDPAGAKMRVR